MLKKIIAVFLLGTMLCSMAAVSFAANPTFEFHITTTTERPNGNSEAVSKNDNEQICYVTTLPCSDHNVTRSSEFYVRSRTAVGNHEASEAMQLTSSNATYHLKYSVRKGVAKTKYNLRGQADVETKCQGRWNP